MNNVRVRLSKGLLRSERVNGKKERCVCVCKSREKCDSCIWELIGNGVGIGHWALVCGMWTLTTTTTRYYFRQLESLPPNTEFSVLTLT